MKSAFFSFDTDGAFGGSIEMEELCCREEGSVLAAMRGKLFGELSMDLSVAVLFV
uniref:Uncharacterized protein n=1 Tax=Lepeophtheirus salmonis TaxID=72036 RepID=A0A0K2TG19_LEPSM